MRPMMMMMRFALAAATSKQLYTLPLGDRSYSGSEIRFWPLLNHDVTSDGI
jgi:hypothetical protein